MSSGLLHGAEAIIPYSYSTMRGWAVHRLLPELFGHPNWMDLTTLKPRAFQNRILELGNKVDCEVTKTFLAEHPEDAAWLAGCYRILLKCLVRDWRIHNVLVMEPQLPTILLPDGSEIRCGVPDMLGDSLAFNGLVNIEMKTGLKRVKRAAAKLARYNSGAEIFAQDNGLNRPFRGTIWISFSSSKLEKKSGRHQPSTKPELTYFFEPFDEQRISKMLANKFGTDARQVANLPRHYTPQFA